MRIGTVRTEEARVFDSEAGYHQFHAAETQEPFGSFEIYWHQPANPPVWSDDDENSEPAGWYWRAGFNGGLPDGEPSGPFASSRQALEDADEWSPEFDPDWNVKTVKDDDDDCSLQAG